MLLDKDKILQAVQLALSNIDKAKKKEQELALLLCLEELSSKLKSASQLLNYTVAVSSGTRKVLLEGDNTDLKFIYAIKYGTGEEQKVLEYKDNKIFLREYDNPSESAGTPTYYTHLESDSGFPYIKFDKPTDKATSIVVYYFPDIDDGNITWARSATAVIDGTLAYFYGKASEAGAVYYNHFREGVRIARAGDDFTLNTAKRFEISKDDKNIYKSARQMQKRRSR